MGNKLGKRRQVVEEKYTRPQGPYQVKDVDYKKLRKLILESKLAPCYPSGDECDCGLLEECTICFLYYPTLNRSRCCMKSICTECFLQMKNPNSDHPTQCPFCKTSNYAVEYRGVKSKEERGLEKIEEQKVIEAKIRMQQEELLEEEHRIRKRQEISTSSGVEESVRSISSQDSHAVSVFRKPQNLRQNRDDEFNLDLEDIMVMEAIWLSKQENERTELASKDGSPPEQYVAATVSSAGLSSSPSGGLACAIAALAERQQMGGVSTGYYDATMSDQQSLPSAKPSGRSKQIHGNYLSAECCKENLTNGTRMAVLKDGEDWLVDHRSIGEAGTSYASSVPLLSPPPPFPSSGRLKQIQGNYPSAECCNEYLTNETRMTVPRHGGHWPVDQRSDIVEAGTSYASSDETDDSSAPVLPPPSACPSSYGIDGTSYSSLDATGHGSAELPPPPPPTQFQYGAQNNYHSVPNPLIPESFEEQMMWAMAVSLAEAQAKITPPRLAWQ